MNSRFIRMAWAILGYTVLVVLWGALVRATGSGAGCGNHWPLCNGEVLPRAPQTETVIEFAHRVTSGLSLVAVAGLCGWAFRLFPRGHRVRRMATLSVVFLLVEALLGAGLVLLDYVAQNASAGRAVYLSAHLVNTQILLAMLTLTAWYARPAAARGTSPRYVAAALPVALAVSVTGAIAALGDTLYPAASLAEGVRHELSETAPALLQLRLLHPVVAVLGSAYLIWAALRVLRTGPPAVTGRMARVCLTLTAVQLACGGLNILLLAPVWMQLVHLLLADALWVALVLLAVEARALRDDAAVAAPAPAVAG